MLTRSRRSSLLVLFSMVGSSCGAADDSPVADGALGTERGRALTSYEVRAARTEADCIPTGGTVIVDDGEFDQELNCWTANIHKPGSAIISVINDPDRPGNKILRVRNLEKQVYYKVQLYQEGRTIELEHCYCLSYRAKASSARRISAQIYQGGPPFSDYGLWATPSLTTKWKPETHCFISKASAADARVGFNFGDNTGSVWLDDIELDDLGSIDELEGCPP